MKPPMARRNHDRIDMLAFVILFLLIIFAATAVPPEWYPKP